MVRVLRLGLLALLAGLLGCALTPSPTPLNVASLLRDERFVLPAQPFDPAALFALSPAMHDYARRRLPSPSSRHDLRRALLQALSDDAALRLRYDAERTLSAAEAFEARAGNCLSLVLMTAAFARHLGQPVSYREVLVPDEVRQRGDLILVSGHINLVLGPPPPSSAMRIGDRGSPLIVDFLPPSDLRSQRSVPLPESTLVAMYLSNRAAEELTASRLDAAYGWAREALLREPSHLGAANTLAVVYQRAGLVDAAEAALRHVLAIEPNHPAALANLVALLQRTGRRAMHAQQNPAAALEPAVR